jgi:DNA repair exonuclease SbcCD nuclease subunit
VKIDICSDLHVDGWMSQTRIHDPSVRLWTGEPFKSTYLYIDWAEYKNPDSEVLIIAGDISNTLMTSVEVVAAASAEYRYVVVVDGNHDHYSNEMTVEAGHLKFRELLSQYANVYLLDHETGLLVDGIAFLGTTGWYDFRAYEGIGISDYLAKRTWGQYSNDSRYPTFECLGPEVLAMHEALGLANQVTTADMDDAIHSIVAVTHMSPRADLMEWKAEDGIWNALTPSYVNTAMDQVLNQNIRGKLKHWVYGHTHSRQVRDIQGVQYINNARGYPKENPPFTLTQIEVAAK